ncbi:MAG: SDR family NAD(P)-dependent oxidoreductase [Pyrinomonadaceae bacterium]
MSVRSIHQFAEKVALISDASSPVGRAVAMQLALNGAYVVGLFQHEGGSVESLVELGTLAHAFQIDPSTDEGSRQAAAEIEAAFGRLDLLVNCLKSRAESEFNSVTEAAFSETMRRNLGSVQFLTNAVFPLMAERPSPRMVNIASTGPDGVDPIFAAAQAGIISLTASMASEFPRKFRINCVEVRDSEGRGGIAGNGVAPDDAARAVLFLLSSESKAMNGQVVRLG